MANHMKENVTKKAAIYARVSSQRQKDGDTIESQIEALKTFALQEGYTVPEKWLFIDNGVSGEMLDRPALDELRDVIRTEHMTAVLAYAPDRLSRKYSHQLILFEEFKKHGVKVRCVKEGPTADTPEAAMLSHFQGIFAEYERALILDRSRRGRIHKAKQGDPCILPSVPFGYKKTKKGSHTIIELVESQANIVKEMFRWFVYDKLTLAAIARKLAEIGVKTKKGGLKWAPSTVRDLIGNPAYTGTSYYGKTEGGEGDQSTIRHYRSGRFLKPKKSKKPVPEELWHPISVPQLISENDFEAAQKQLRINKATSSRNTKQPGLLQGLVVCGECGHRFYKRSRKYKGTIKSYYYCQSYQQYNLNKCANGWARQEELDAIVYGEVIKLLQNPAIIREELSRRTQEISNREETVAKEVHLKKEAQQISKERDKLLDAYQAGILDLRDLQERNERLSSRRNTLEKEIRALEALKVEKEEGTDIERIFRDLLERMQKNAGELSFEERRKLIRLLVQEVIVGPKDVKIIHCVSLNAMARTAQENCQLKPDCRC